MKSNNIYMTIVTQKYIQEMCLIIYITILHQYHVIATYIYHQIIYIKWSSIINTIFSDHQIWGKPYISINMTTATDNECNEIESKTVFKIEEIIKIIEVGNHIQFQSQPYFLVNDYQSRISSEIANLNEALENICRILLDTVNQIYNQISWIIIYKE